MAAAVPITPEFLSQRTTSINDAIARISSAATAYAETTGKELNAHDDANISSKTAEVAAVAARDALEAEVKKLLAEVQGGPAGAMYDLVGSVCRATALRCLLDMGVFAALPASGTGVTVGELLARMGGGGGGDVVEEALLVRLLRNITASGAGPGPVVEVGEGVYARTAGSEGVLGMGGSVAMFKQMFDEHLPALIMMPGFFRENGGWRVPTEPTNCPYTFAHRTEGKDCWSHIAQFPERQANCNEAMKAQSFSGVWAVGLYPFVGKLQKSGGDEKTPLVVDVGGGAGYTSRKIRELCEGVKGTVVLQDLEGVVADAEDVDGIEKMAHDFFSEQPVKGAHIYYLRRILHDWSDDSSVAILKHLAAAMDRDLPSRVVIAEQILPASSVSSQSAFIDMVMMTFTGMERTEKQWKELLARAGLRIERVYTAPGTPFGAIEAVLA